MIRLKCFTLPLKLVCSFLVCLSILIQSSFAKNNEERIAVIDIDFVISQSKPYQEFKKNMDKNYAQYKKEISEYENEIIELDKKISKEKDKLSDKELTILKSTLNSREISIQRMIQKRRISLDENHSNQLDKIKKQLYQVIESEAKKNNYVVVLSKNNIIYSNKKLDISNVILEQFNNNYKDE